VRFGFAACGPALVLSLVACTTTTGNLPSRLPDAQPGWDYGYGYGPGEQPVPDKQVKVGLLLSITGPAGELGQDMLRAAQMALFDAGENDVVLLPRDTRGSAEGARLAATELVEEGAELLIGPLFSQEVSAVTPIANQAGIRMIAFSNVATVAKDGSFLLGFRPEEQVERVVRYALQRGYRRFAGLGPDDAYGATALNALRQAVIAGGGELADTLTYPPDLADPSSVVREVADYDERAKELEEEKKKLEGREDEASKRALERLETLDTLGEPPFDAILIADGGDRLRSVASLLTFYDVDPAVIKFLGTIRWQDDPRVLYEGALQQGWFAAPSPNISAAFEQRYQSNFGTAPQQLAALAYDATALAVIVQRDLGDRSFNPDTLTDPEGFAGATGLFRLRQDGLADHGLGILEVRQGKAEEIDVPPARFSDEVAFDGVVPPGAPAPDGWPGVDETGAVTVPPAPSNGPASDAAPGAIAPAPAAGAPAEPAGAVDLPAEPPASSWLPGPYEPTPNPQ
jgi:ABC-type branched-subunit amino acid transport system substrate-binding protein